MVPQPPPFGSGIRVASAADVPRLAIICMAGYEYSESFKFSCPNNGLDPDNTRDHFSKEMHNYIESPEYVVLVKTDKYDPNEAEKTCATLPPDLWPRQVRPAPGWPTIVSAVVIHFPKGSKRIGQAELQPAMRALMEPDDPKSSLFDFGRSIGKKELYQKIDNEYELHKMVNIVRLVTHPAYWRRGHASALCQWVIDLKKMDAVSIGAVSSRPGTEFLKRMEFKELCKLHLDGDERDPKGHDLWVMRW